MTQTDDMRVSDICKIIGRDKSHIDEIEQAIHKVDSYRRYLEPGRPTDRSKPFTKVQKKKAQSLASAFERLERTLNRRPGGRYVDRVLLNRHPGFEEFDEYVEWKDRLPHWRKHFKAIAEWPLGQPKASDQRFALKHRAAAVAAGLLESHGLPLTVTYRLPTETDRPPTVSPFCRIAAVLYGDKRVNLYHQCRLIREARNRGPN